MPFGKPGQVLCAVCREQLKATDETYRIEGSNALAHTRCMGVAASAGSREHVRLLLFKTARCKPCLLAKTKISEELLDEILEQLQPETVAMGTRCEDCHRLRLVYTIR